MTSMMNLLAELKFRFEDANEMMERVEMALDEIAIEMEGRWQPPLEALAFIALARCAIGNAARVMHKSITESWEEIDAGEEQMP